MNPWEAPKKEYIQKSLLPWEKPKVDREQLLAEGLTNIEVDKQLGIPATGTAFIPEKSQFTPEEEQEFGLVKSQLEVDLARSERDSAKARLDEVEKESFFTTGKRVVNRILGKEEIATQEEVSEQPEQPEQGRTTGIPLAGRAKIIDETEPLERTEADNKYLEELKLARNIGQLQTELGQIKGQIIFEGISTPESQARADEIKKQLQEITPEKTRKFYDPQQILLGTAELTPLMEKSIMEGTKTGLISATGASAIAAASGVGIPAIPPIAGISYTVGQVYGSAKFMAYAEGGLAYDEMKDLGIDDKIAIPTAQGIGVINAGIEMMQLKMILNTIPGFKGLLSKGVKFGVKELTKKSLFKKLLKTGIDYVKFLAGELTQEESQEVITILGTEFAKDISNKIEDTDIPKATQEEIVDRLVETFKGSLGLAVLGIPGTSAQAVTDIKTSLNNEAQVLQDDLAKITGETPTEPVLGEGISEVEPTEITQEERQLNTVEEFTERVNQADQLLQEGEIGEAGEILGDIFIAVTDNASEFGGFFKTEEGAKLKALYEELDAEYTEAEKGLGKLDRAVIDANKKEKADALQEEEKLAEEEKIKQAKEKELTEEAVKPLEKKEIEEVKTEKELTTEEKVINKVEVADEKTTETKESEAVVVAEEKVKEEITKIDNIIETDIEQADKLMATLHEEYTEEQLATPEHEAIMTKLQEGKDAKEEVETKKQTEIKEEKEVLTKVAQRDFDADTKQMKITQARLERKKATPSGLNKGEEKLLTKLNETIKKREEKPVPVEKKQPVTPVKKKAKVEPKPKKPTVKESELRTDDIFSLVEKPPKTKTEKRKKIPSTYEQKKDDWFGNKDWENIKADIEAKEFEDRIKKATDKKNWKQVNEAIHVYLDMKRNPTHAKKFYSKLTEEQQNIVDIAQNLTKEQKAIAEDISKSYEKIGLKALSKGVIQNILDNYVSRAWKMEDKPSSQFWNKFSTKSRHAKKRVLETILEGWSLGMELDIKGATANLYTLKTEINNVIEDKKLLQEGKKIKDADGNPLFSNKKLDGYKEIDHPNFKEWKFIGSIGVDLTKAQAQTYTGDVVITSDGVVLQRKPLYAPKKVANNLNNILGQSKLKGIKTIDVITKYNAVIKAWILQTSLFHHLAFARSFLFGGALNRINQINVRNSYRKGLKSISNLSPEVELLVRNGLTLGKMQDWNEEILKQETFIDKIADKNKISKAVKDKIKTFREEQAKFLFNKYGAGIKAYAGILEYNKQLKENPEMSPNERAKMVADLVNDDFGGLHLGRMGRNPTVQHIFRLFALAPDWTESNIRSMAKAIKSGTKEETKMYRRFWGRIALRGLMLTTAINLLMASIDKDEPEEKYFDTVKRRYKEAWDKGYLKWLDADITPVYRALGGKKSKAFFPVIGHFKDPIKFITKPARSAVHKGSVVTRLILEAIFGVNWQKRPFTEWDELIGLDTEHWSPHFKGKYKTTKAGKYKEGELKGGKLKGQLTKFDFKGGHPVDYSTLPSYLLHEVRSTQPVQVQNFISWLNGEIDWFQAIGSSTGLGITTSEIYKEDKKKSESFGARIERQENERELR